MARARIYADTQGAIRHAVTLLLNLSLTPFDWRRWPGVAAMPGDGRAGRDGQRVSFRALLARTPGTARAWRGGRSRRLGRATTASYE